MSRKNITHIHDRNDSQPWRRLMRIEGKKQPTPRTPLRPVRCCARCGREFISTHHPDSLAACFCPECAHMVPEGWED